MVRLADTNYIAMNDIKKSPIDSLGYNFIDRRYLPEGKDEYYLRYLQKGKDACYRQLTAYEIEVLVRNRNTSANWNDILVSDAFKQPQAKDVYDGGGHRHRNDHRTDGLRPEDEPPHDIDQYSDAQSDQHDAREAGSTSLPPCASADGIVTDGVHRRVGCVVQSVRDETARVRDHPRHEQGRSECDIQPQRNA